MTERHIDEEEARRAALQYLGERVSLEYCPEPPPGFYSPDPAAAYFHFAVFRDEDIARVGGGEYISVPKSTGGMILLGRHGE